MRYESLIIVLVVTQVSFPGVETARILGLFMGQGRSHYVLGSSLLRILSESGHEVLLVSQYGADKIYGPNYTEIVVKNEDESDNFFNSLKQVNHLPYDAVDRMHQYSKTIIPKVFEEFNSTNIMNSTFDVVIIEQTFMDALKVFAWHFKAHLIVFHPRRADNWINSYIGNPNFPSFIPEYPTTYNPNMSFFQRLENMLLYLYDTLFREYLCLKENNEVIQKYFPGAPELSEIAYNTALVLLNSDVAMDQPVPKVPNMIDIAGFHIETPKPLPADAITFMDNSTKGIVYVNLGEISSHYISEETRNFFIKMFSGLEHDVVWQWDEESVPDQTDNIFIRKNLPQQNVLAHPNVKLFIHLGDSTGILEGLNYGIPQLFLPVTDDQLYNAAEAQYFGYAWTLPFAKVNEEDFVWALRELLDNPKYLLESRRRSKLLKEKPVSQKKAAKFWVNYVLLTNGAKHMRSASLNYCWYQLLLLDVIGFISLIILLILVILRILICLIWRRCCCYKKKSMTMYADYISVDQSEMF